MPAPRPISLLFSFLLAIAAATAPRRSPLAADVDPAEYDEILRKISAPDGSVCFNDCSGHGRCEAYSCICDPGYYGDDCRHHFSDFGGKFPILSVGHGNITHPQSFKALLQRQRETAKRRKKRRKKKAEEEESGVSEEDLGALAPFAAAKWLLVGMSSHSCHKCVLAETAYAALLEDADFKARGVPLLRLDAGQPVLRALGLRYGLEAGAAGLPHLALFRDGQLVQGYHGVSTATAIGAYVTKQMTEEPFSGEPTTAAEVAAFLRGEASPDTGVMTTYVVGCFRDPEDLEEDEFGDFREAAERLRGRHDIYFAMARGSRLAEELLSGGYIDRTPALVLQRSRGPELAWLLEEDGEFGGGAGAGSVGHQLDRRLWPLLPGAVSVNFDELSLADGDEQSVVGWVQRNSIPTLQELTPRNFAMYASLGLPMLILFLRLGEGSASSGETGAVANRVLLQEFATVAREFRGRIFCVFADGVAYADHMRVLGIDGGESDLPAMAWNTVDNRKVPFPKMYAYNRETMGQFVADFLSGKMNSRAEAEELAKKQLQRAQPLSSLHMPRRGPKPPPPEHVTGVAEQFSQMATTGVVALTPDTWDSVALAEDRDVLVMFHEQNCEGCAHLTPYYRRVGQRFYEEGIKSVVVARYDLTGVEPPIMASTKRTILAGALPVVILLPAFDKDLPLYYSGVGKVLEIMRWVEGNAGVKFKLPLHAHLSPADREEYRVQVTDREVSRAKKRQEDAEAMAKEEERQAEWRRRKDQADEDL